MKTFDYFLQRRRIDQVRPYIRPGARVLDIGSSDGALFHQIHQIGQYVGIDPAVTESTTSPDGRFQLVRGLFPENLPDEEPFDVISLLAVLEHIPPSLQQSLAKNCSDYLRTNGYLVITVPSPLVDPILTLLRTFKIIDGMALEEHYGYQTSQTTGLFTSEGLTEVVRKRFQLGLNNLFVFRKSGEKSQRFFRTHST